MAKADTQSTEVAVKEDRNPLAFLDRAKPIPAKMHGLVDIRSWAECILTGEKYREPNPDYLNKRMLMAVLDSEDLFSANEETSVLKLQQWVTDVPDASTGPIELTNVYVAPSRLSDDPWTFILVDFTHLLTGDMGTFSTGSTQVQGFILKAICLGMFPAQCQIKRITRTDRGGRHLFNIFPAFD